MKKAILTLFGIFLFTSVFTQAPGYRISISLEGYSDTIAYLGHYYGDKLSVSDTATGTFAFDLTSPALAGTAALSVAITATDIAGFSPAVKSVTKFAVISKRTKKAITIILLVVTRYLQQSVQEWMN